MLDGSSPDLLLQRGIDLFTGEPTRGANVDLTINPKAQKAAYDALKQSGKRGAVVAIDPKTGAILAMVSLPTYDPGELSGTNKGQVFGRYDELAKQKSQPLLNRNIDRTYPPGSTFKVVTAAAFLEDDSGRDAQTVVDAPQVLQLPNTTAGLPNYGGAACGSGQVTLVFALEKSCNTPFGSIGMDLGYDKMNEQADEVRRGAAAGRPDVGGEEQLRREGGPGRGRPGLHRPAQRPDDAAADGHDRRGHRQRRHGHEALPGQQDHRRRRATRSTRPIPRSSARRSARRPRASCAR